MTRVTSPRRRERPRRLVAALALLSLSTAAAVVALLVGTVGALVAAVVAAVVLSWVAARLAHDQVVDERRRHAEDRVDQARAYRSLVLERKAEHTLFASRMRDRVLHAERLAAELRGILRLAEVRADEAEARARQAAVRARTAQVRVVELEAELEAELADRRPDLIDELAAWEVVPGLDQDTVVELLTWEERATAGRVVEQRRRA
jgi:hypothetical protein